MGPCRVPLAKGKEGETQSPGSEESVEHDSLVETIVERGT
jgi:hypothetical protein